MVRLTLRLPDEVHEKIRWLSYKERRSMQAIITELLENALKEIDVQKEEPR